jgi:hypothetical protein
VYQSTGQLCLVKRYICGAQRTPMGPSFEPLVSKNFGARRQALLQPCFRGPSRANTFEAASDRSSYLLGAHRGVGPLSPVHWDPRGLLLAEGSPPPVPSFSAMNSGQPRAWGHGSRGLSKSIAHAFLGDMEILHGCSRFYRVVMIASARAWWFWDSGARVTSIALTAAARPGPRPFDPPAPFIIKNNGCREGVLP